MINASSVAHCLDSPFTSSHRFDTLLLDLCYWGTPRPVALCRCFTWDDFHLEGTDNGGAAPVKSAWCYLMSFGVLQEVRHCFIFRVVRCMSASSLHEPHYKRKTHELSVSQRKGSSHLAYFEPTFEFTSTHDGAAIRCRPHSANVGLDGRGFRHSRSAGMSMRWRDDGRDA